MTPSDAKAPSSPPYTRGTHPRCCLPFQSAVRACFGPQTRVSISFFSFFSSTPYGCKAPFLMFEKALVQCSAVAFGLLPVHIGESCFCVILCTLCRSHAIDPADTSFGFYFGGERDRGNWGGELGKGKAERTRMFCCSGAHRLVRGGEIGVGSTHEIMVIPAACSMRGEAHCSGKGWKPVMWESLDMAAFSGACIEGRSRCDGDVRFTWCRATHEATLAVSG
jgi:hypothetical protein